jgi:hypothetical protein
VHNDAGSLPLGAPDLSRFLSVAAGPHRAPQSRLAPGGLGAGAPAARPLHCQQVRRAWRAWATRQVIFAHATPGADVANIEGDDEPLLHM